MLKQWRGTVVAIPEVARHDSDDLAIDPIVEMPFAKADGHVRLDVADDGTTARAGER